LKNNLIISPANPNINGININSNFISPAKDSNVNINADIKLLVTNAFLTPYFENAKNNIKYKIKAKTEKPYPPVKSVLVYLIKSYIFVTFSTLVKLYDIINPS